MPAPQIDQVKKAKIDRYNDDDVVYDDNTVSYDDSSVSYKNFTTSEVKPQIDADN